MNDFQVRHVHSPYSFGGEVLIKSTMNPHPAPQIPEHMPGHLPLPASGRPNAEISLDSLIDKNLARRRKKANHTHHHHSHPHNQPARPSQSSHTRIPTPPPSAEALRNELHELALRCGATIAPDWAPGLSGQPSTIVDGSIDGVHHSPSVEDLFRLCLPCTPGVQMLHPTASSSMDSLPAPMMSSGPESSVEELARRLAASGSMLMDQYNNPNNNFGGMMMPTSSSYATEPQCDHTPHWRRLRVKKGMSHFLCKRCGAKWRIPRDSE